MRTLDITIEPRASLSSFQSLGQSNVTSTLWLDKALACSIAFFATPPIDSGQNIRSRFFIFWEGLMLFVALAELRLASF